MIILRNEFLRYERGPKWKHLYSARARIGNNYYYYICQCLKQIYKHKTRGMLYHLGLLKLNSRVFDLLLKKKNIKKIILNSFIKNFYSFFKVISRTYISFTSLVIYKEFIYILFLYWYRQVYFTANATFLFNSLVIISLCISRICKVNWMDDRISYA